MKPTTDNAVTMWTDGSSNGRRGPGGWAAILTFGKAQREISGGFPSGQTNNSMELYAILQGLQSFTHSVPVVIHTDSQNAICWIKGEYRCKLPHLRKILTDIRRVIAEKGLTVSFCKVLAHAGVKNNERADLLANAGRHHATKRRREWMLDDLFIDGKVTLNRKEW